MVNSIESIDQTLISLDEFLKLPETKPYSEYINGKIEQKSMLQGQHSVLQGSLATAINQKVLENKIAYAFPELRCTFGGRSLVPDISVFTWQRIPKNEKGKIANRFLTYPDWVIEILSPEQSANKVMRKIMFCLGEGTKLGWLIDTEDESVMILKPNQFPEIKVEKEILPVLDDIKNLDLSVEKMFSWLSF
ncbi:Uma2 family endonuclease [Cyanobacterium stanieri LEGE 03274]|uniref:Uma2 family endonuclease n=1 Tax=Cyanobacterium stanieri LEGE 03274 TaxID=1828756 RepID=A0ABR9V4G3_9CHRO|nr:Uma2 family endonuclease [Cyanobacterium stanieri]MBE9221719.1 Uma2 family endonuclease [Cyanobacterium stanieri LEGE 03274]